MALAKTGPGSPGPPCAVCGKTSMRRVHGYWCTRCRRWIGVGIPKLPAREKVKNPR